MFSILFFYYHVASAAPVSSVKQIQNTSLPISTAVLSPEVVVSDGVPVAIVFPEATQAPLPLQPGETVLIQTSEGSFEMLVRSEASIDSIFPQREDQKQLVGKSDLEAILRRLLEKQQLASLPQKQEVTSQSITEQSRQLATLIPEPTSITPADILVFPSPEQLGPNAIRVADQQLHPSSRKTIVLQIPLTEAESIRNALPTALLAPPVTSQPTDVPIPTEIPPPFSQVGGNVPFFFLGPPTFVNPNQTTSRAVLDRDELAKQIGNYIIHVVSRKLEEEFVQDDFERYIIGEQSVDLHHLRGLGLATQAPTPTSTHQSTTIPLSLSNLPPPPAVVLPNGSLVS
eukprot:jgi/Galph1/3373/GphlegSOOS_G2055.1